MNINLHDPQIAFVFGLFAGFLSCYLGELLFLFTQMLCHFVWKLNVSRHS